MYYVIVLSGDIRNDPAILTMLDRADKIIAADGGARHLRRFDRIPDLLIGDLDSIDAESLSWLAQRKVSVRRFPVEKDATDSELALAQAAAEGGDMAAEQTIVLAGALGSRPDHVLANQLLAARFAQKDRRIILTDGLTYIHTLVGGQSLELDLPAPDVQKMAVSLIPVTAEAEGVSCSGLKYGLEQAALELGSTLGVSNRPAGIPAVPGQDKACPVRVSLETGIILVVVTPEI